MKIKSTLIIIISIFIVVATIILEYHVNGFNDYNKSIISDEEYQVLLSKRTLVDTPLLDEIYIDNQKLIYDAYDNTFYCSKIDGQDFEHITEGKNQNNSIAEIIGLNQIHTAIIPNEKLILYNRHSISVSSLVISSLPFVNVFVSPETVTDLNLDETYFIEQYTEAELSIYDNRADFDGVNRTINSDIKIHARGGTTINQPPKSYRITLIDDKENTESANKKENLFGLREDDDWILYSSYSDYEKVRNVFSMNLWNKTASYHNEWNVPASNEYIFVEAFFNNRYHGLYAFTYPIDSKQLNRQDDESIIQKKGWLGSEYAQDVEYNEDLGYDWLADYFLQKGSPDSYYVIHDLFYAMTYSGDNEVIRSTVDMNNAIDLYLFYELSQAADNIYDTKLKNLFVINKQADNEFGYKLLFVPWDMDQTWGNRYVEGQGNHAITSYNMAYDYELPVNWGPVPFLIQNGDETIVDEVQARYDTLRKTVWSDDNILEMLESYEDDIYTSGAYARTMVRWPDANYYDPEVELNDFKEFVLARLHWMDEYISHISM